MMQKATHKRVDRDVGKYFGNGCGGHCVRDALLVFNSSSTEEICTESQPQRAPRVTEQGVRAPFFLRSRPPVSQIPLWFESRSPDEPSIAAFPDLRKRFGGTARSSSSEAAHRIGRCGRENRGRKCFSR